MIDLEQIKKTVISKSGFTQDTLNDTISLHFRLGDYKKLQHYHPIMTYEYYKKSLNHKKAILPFSCTFICYKEAVKLYNKPFYN